MAARRANASSRIPTTTKAQTAHLANSKLSAAMEMAMRSTISGRERPYMRDNTWAVIAMDSKKKRKADESSSGKKKIAASTYTAKTRPRPAVLDRNILREAAKTRLAKGKGKILVKRTPDPGKRKRAIRSLASRTAVNNVLTASDDAEPSSKADEGMPDKKRKPPAYQKIRYSELLLQTPLTCRCLP